MYLPVQMGHAIHPGIGYIGDDTGENISERNGNFCELTGLYWAAKNLDSDYIGIVHYRRYFASSMHLSRNLLQAARDIVEGEPHTLDLGSFNGRCFSYVASFGAFTRASYATSQRVKNALGHLAYVLGGIKELPSIRSRPATDSHSASMVASASTGRFRSCGVVTLLP